MLLQRDFVSEENQSSIRRKFRVAQSRIKNWHETDDDLTAAHAAVWAAEAAKLFGRVGQKVADKLLAYTETREQIAKEMALADIARSSDAYEYDEEFGDTRLEMAAAMASVFIVIGLDIVLEAGRSAMKRLGYHGKQSRPS